MMAFVYQLVYYITLPFTAFNTLATNIPGIRNLGKITLPTRIAWLVFVFLFFVLVSFCVTFQFSDTSAQWTDYLLDWKTGLTVLGLMIIIPIVSYYVVKIWMEEDSSEYPDIDKAWKQGITELDKHGIPLGSTPLFLVLGNPDDRRARNLMRASGFGFNVSDPAQGPAALHWYANPDAVFIFLTGTSCLSTLTDGYKNHATKHSQLATPSPQQIPGGQTIVAGAGQQSLINEQLEHTMGADEDEDEQRFMEAPRSMQAGVGATMDFGQGMAGGQTMNFGADDAAQAASMSKSGMRQSKSDLTDQMERLKYVCKLINKARRPVCPINGLLVTIPFDMIEDSSEPIQLAVQSDLDVIRSTTRLRCSVTALITEMESAQGFLELIKRVGEKRAKEQRFGKGFNVWNPPIAEQLEAVSQHATGAFEDWTYLLFREKDGLRRPGNPKLFELLCKIRGKFSECMTNIIANSFGFEPDKNPRAAGNSLLFAGCYFAATGDTGDRQAFVRSVLYKVMEQDAELDWNKEALEENTGAEFAANIAALIGGVCLLILIGFGLNSAFGEYMPWHQDQQQYSDMSRRTLYVYAEGNDHYFLEEVIEDQVYSFITQRSWNCHNVRAVNQRGDYDDPSLGPDDLPDWDIGLNLSLPDPGQELPGWFEDIRSTAMFFHECAIINGAKYVIGIYDNESGVSADLFQIDTEVPDMDKLQQFIGVGGIEQRFGDGSRLLEILRLDSFLFNLPTDWGMMNSLISATSHSLPEGLRPCILLPNCAR